MRPNVDRLMQEAGSQGHSIPTNMAVALLQGVEEVPAFLYEHAEIVLRELRPREKLTVSFILDSSCGVIAEP